MAYQLKERPHKIAYSRNPVRYVFNITNPETPGCALEIELHTLDIDEALPDTGLGLLISKQTLYPNPDGKVYFYCEDLLNAYLEWELPALAVNQVIAVKKQIRKYFVRYRQITSDNLNPQWATDAESIRMVMKGGVTKAQYSRNNIFVNFMPAQKPFLTWQVKDDFIGAKERRYLTYYHNADTLPALQAKARIVYTDGSQETASLDFPSLEESKLFHIPAGIIQMGLADLHPDKQMWYYDVSVEDADGNVLAKPFRLNLDYRQFYEVFDMIYHNSLGGIDTLRIKAPYDAELTRDYTDVQNVLGYNYDFAEKLPAENDAINISCFKVYKGDVGFFNSARSQESALELLHSESVYRVIYGRWLKIEHMQKSQKLGGSDDTKWNFELQYRYTYTDTQFTPQALDFGLGINDEPSGAIYGTCTAPSGLKVEHIGGSNYRFTWDSVSASIGYELQLVQANTALGWAVALEKKVVGNTVDIEITQEVEYMWRVRTKCGDNDYSGYAPGNNFVVNNTPALCTQPANLKVLLLSLSGNKAQVKFIWDPVPGSQGYTIEWAPVASANWNSELNATTSFIVELDKDTQWQFRVRNKCAANSFSAYLVGESFIPSNMIGSCSAPTNLQVYTGGSNFIRVFGFSWTNAGNTTSYEFRYRIQGDANWIVATNVQSGHIEQTGTFPGSHSYEWQVRSICSGGGFSPWVNGPEWNT